MGQIAQGPLRDIDDMELEAERLAAETARVDHPLGFIEREAERQGVDDAPPLSGGAAGAFLDQAVDVVIAHRPPADRPLQVEEAAFRAAAGQRDGHLLQPVLGPVLGLGHRRADHALRRIEIDDRPCLDPLRPLPAETGHPDLPVRRHLADQADHLGRADIQHAEGAAARRPPPERGLPPRLGQHET